MAEIVLKPSKSEVGNWKSKYENDAVSKIAVLEDEKKRLSTRLAESDQSLQNASARCQTLEKATVPNLSFINDYRMEISYFYLIYLLDNDLQPFEE